MLSDKKLALAFKYVVLLFVCLIPFYFKDLVFPSSPKSEDVSSSFSQFYIKSILKEAAKEDNSDFPLYSLIQIHEKNVSKLEVEGFSRDFLDQVFKRFMFDRYGLNYLKNKSLIKNDLGYILYIGPSDKKNYSFKVVEKEDRVFIVASPRDGSLGHVKRVKNLVIPKPKNVRYDIAPRDEGVFSIKPVVLSKN